MIIQHLLNSILLYFYDYEIEIIKSYLMKIFIQLNNDEMINFRKRKKEYYLELFKH